MNLVFKYDEIVKKFNSDLVNKLRKHGSEESDQREKLHKNS